MRTFSLQDPALLRQLPERGPLLLLLAALDVADSSLRIQHPRLDTEPAPPAPALPPTELLAELLLARFAELETLVTRYNDAVNDALGVDQLQLVF
jgi:hypothetical protein